MSTVSLRFLLWIPQLAYILGVQAGTNSVIVDDAATNQIVYSKTGWNVGNYCVGCAAQPAKDQARDGTWHDGTESADRPDEVYFTFNFTGTSIEARYIAIDIIGPWTTNTNVTYSIDGGSANVKQRASTNRTDYLYDQLLFRIDGLSNVEHTLRVDIQQPGVLLLDYLNYTEVVADVPTTTSLGPPSSFSPSPSSPAAAFNALGVNVGAIIGGVLSGVVIIIVASTFWFCLKRRRKTAQARLAPIPIVTQVPPLHQPHVPEKLAGRTPYDLQHPEHGDQDGLPIYSGTYRRPAVSSEVPSDAPSITLDTLKSTSMSALLSHPAVPSRRGDFHSAGNRGHIRSPSPDEPVEQGLMSVADSPQNSPPAYSQNAL